MKAYVPKSVQVALSEMHGLDAATEIRRMLPEVTEIFVDGGDPVSTTRDSREGNRRADRPNRQKTT